MSEAPTLAYQRGRFTPQNPPTPLRKKISKRCVTPEPPQVVMLLRDELVTIAAETPFDAVVPRMFGAAVQRENTVERKEIAPANTGDSSCS